MRSVFRTMPGSVADSSDLLGSSAGEAYGSDNFNGFSPPVIMGYAKLSTTRLIMLILFVGLNGSIDLMPVVMGAIRDNGGSDGKNQDGDENQGDGLFHGSTSFIFLLN